MKWLLNFLKGTWLGHPLHPIFVHVPMAMWPGALIFDLFSRWNGNAMVRLSFYAIISGWSRRCWPCRREKSASASGPQPRGPYD